MEKVKPKNTGGSWGLTDSFAEIVIKHIQPAQIIDFGAGMGKYGKMIRAILGANVYILAIDIFEKSVEWLKPQLIYSQVMMCDIAEYPFHNHSQKFDLAIFGDVLEHLEYSEIKRILKQIKEAKIYKYIMIVVPLGDVEQGSCGGNEAERHKCIISEVLLTEDIKDMGYRISHKYVVSADGPKGEYKKMLLIIK